jgi:hypothetical protein
LAGHVQYEVEQKIHMDLTSDTGHLPVREIIGRAAWFFGYLIGFMAVMAVIGLIPTVAVFVVFFMRWEARERWTLVIPYATALVVFIWFTFDYVMAVPWPPTLLGQWFPYLKVRDPTPYVRSLGLAIAREDGRKRPYEARPHLQATGLQPMPGFDPIATRS